MANSDSPFGLRPIRNLNGSDWNNQVKKYYVPASDTDDMFIGDPVVLAGSSDTRGIPTAQLATAGATNKITGVIVGVLVSEGREGDNVNLNKVYREGGVRAYLQVCEDPDTIFEVQFDDSATLATTDVGLNFNLASGTGNTTNGISGWEAATSTAATTNTLQVHLMRVLEADDNEVGDFARGEVLINLHSYTRPITGV